MLFRKRLEELANRSYANQQYLFTGFLSAAELDIYYQMEHELSYASAVLFGGTNDCERLMLRFGSEALCGYEELFPIACVAIVPLLEKFGEVLSHRDYLGALMNLGIERSTVGDIKTGEKQAYLFCLESIAGFICENLDQVKHTRVKCSVTEDYQSIPKEEPVLNNIHVPSLRVDAVLARVYNMSREKSQELFRNGKVYVDGRLCENHSRQLKAGETVNARGYGKFTLMGEGRETKKGRLSVEAAVYR